METYIDYVHKDFVGKKYGFDEDRSNNTNPIGQLICMRRYSNGEWYFIGDSGTVSVATLFYRSNSKDKNFDRYVLDNTWVPKC